LPTVERPTGVTVTGCQRFSRLAVSRRATAERDVCAWRAVVSASVIAGLVMLASACGSAGTSPPQRSPSGSLPPSRTARTALPTLTVSPDTTLSAGQQVKIALSGFPRRATVSVYECADTSAARNIRGCGAASSLILYTSSSGGATGPFVAQPAASAGPHGRAAACLRQCVLVGTVIKLGGALPPRPATTATAPLAFAPHAASPLANAALQNLTWINPTEGWALATEPCTQGTCIRLASTTDGGEHWHALPDPPAHMQDGEANCSRQACVTSVQFATPTIGYLYGPALLMTTDGGRTWRRVPGLQTETLNAADGHAYRVAYAHDGCPGPCQPILQQAEIGSTNWQPMPSSLVPPDRSGEAQIVQSGATLLLALYGSQAGPVSAQASVYRSTNAGQSWRHQNDPCAGLGPNPKTEEDLTDLASSPAGFLAGLCTAHVGRGTFVVTSSDGGAHWRPTNAVPSEQGLALVAAASATTLAVATSATSGNGPFTAQLLVSIDQGRHWHVAATDPQQVTQVGVPAWIGFETSEIGRWIGDPHDYWTTHDGGRSWTRAAFR
jgi:photosystem II stability/assembly factor-like uncharacterized protein